jgi:hypothetical protein
MANGKSGAFREGASLVWRRQLVLWWIFIVNLALGWLSIRGLETRVGDVLDHSLASGALVNRFDLSLLGEMAVQPGISPLSVSPAAFGYSAVFFLFMLLATGGILDVYRRDASLSTAEFFEAGGTFFWRFFRLLIYLLIFLIPLDLLLHGSQTLADRIADHAVSPMASIWFRVGSHLVAFVVLLILRLWFDMAEVHTVVSNERSMRRALAEAWRITFGNFRRLFSLFLRIGIVGALGLAFGLWLWMDVLRPEAIYRALILSQALILWMLAIRLWLRASETEWYRMNVRIPEPEPAPPPAYISSLIETQTLADEI